jgi:hypothetical protein
MEHPHAFGASLLALPARLGAMGYYGVGGGPNYMQPAACIIGRITSSETASRKTGCIYWSVGAVEGNRGGRTEWIADFDRRGWDDATIAGPVKERWGLGTKLLPVIQFAVGRTHSESARTLVSVLIDNPFDDEAGCVSYCLQLGKDIAAARTPPIRFLLIGFGMNVDLDQLGRMEDMFESTEWEGQVDLWSSRLVVSVCDHFELAEVVRDEIQCITDATVAPLGAVTTRTGRVLAEFTAGLPSSFTFRLPPEETGFRIHMPNMTVEQDCSEGLGGNA